MNDDEIIKQVAQLWVSCGGDDIGFSYCTGKIQDKISEILKEER